MFKKAIVETPSVEIQNLGLEPVDRQTPKRRLLNVRRIIFTTGIVNAEQRVELPMAGVCDWVYVYCAESIGWGFTTGDMILPLANGKASIRFMPLQDTFVIRQTTTTNPLTVYVVEGTGDPAAFGVGV